MRPPTTTTYGFSFVGGNYKQTTCPGGITNDTVTFVPTNTAIYPQQNVNGVTQCATFFGVRVYGSGIGC